MREGRRDLQTLLDLLHNQRSCMPTDLFPVQPGGDADLSGTRVDGELPQRVSADDGVAQPAVDGPVPVGGRYLRVIATVLPASASTSPSAAPTKLMNLTARSEVRAGAP